MSVTKVRRLRLLTPMIVAPIASATSSSRSSWTSVRTSRPSASGGVVQLAQPIRRERRHDQQHRVRAGRARLVELVRVDDEVLAQDRNRHRGAHRTQILERAAEEALVGEHRDRGGAGGRVAARDRDRIVRLAQHALRGRAALALGDDRRTRARAARPRSRAAARRTARSGAAPRPAAARARRRPRRARARRSRSGYRGSAAARTFRPRQARGCFGTLARTAYRSPGSPGALSVFRAGSRPRPW